jgi:DNA-binding IclR family transcriptional regulator
VKLTSTVGGRNPAHCTAVGKLMLSYDLPDLASVQEWLGTRTLQQRTPRTLLRADQLHAELERTRERGYGLDDRENEEAVNCLAVPVFLTSPNRPCGAVSISALVYRTPLAKLIEHLPEIRAIADGSE